MLYKNYTTEIIGFQDVQIKNMVQNDEEINIWMQLKKKTQECPCCGRKTKKIHDYRDQIIKDIPAFGKNVIIHFKKR